MQLSTLVSVILFAARLGAVVAHPRALHGHQAFHKDKRAEVVVTNWDIVTDIITDVVVVTVPAGQVTSTAAATTTTSSTVVVVPSSVSTVSPAGSTIAASGNFFQAGSTTLTTLTKAPHNKPTPPAETLASSSAEAASSSAAPSTSEVASPSAVPAPVSSAVSSEVAPVAPSTTFVVSTSVTPVASYSSVALKAPSSSAAAASSTVAASSSAKRGLAYNDASLTDAFSGSSVISWAYNWGSSTSEILSDLEYVPMLWGNKEWFTSIWSTEASAAIASGSTHLLAFNEPDNSDTSVASDMSYTDAATAYQTYMEPFAGKAKLGAPAVTNGGAPGGLTWLSNFLDACAGCTIDFVPIHWYDSASNYAYFQQHVMDAYVAGGNRSLWITEFGATGTDDEVANFLQIVMPWLDSLDFVERYAYFMVEDGVLISSGTQLSTIGSTFAEYTSSTISSLLESTSDLLSSVSKDLLSL